MDMRNCEMVGHFLSRHIYFIWSHNFVFQMFYNSQSVNSTSFLMKYLTVLQKSVHQSIECPTVALTYHAILRHAFTCLVTRLHHVMSVLGINEKCIKISFYKYCIMHSFIYFVLFCFCFVFINDRYFVKRWVK